MTERTAREKMLAGEPYLPAGDPELAEMNLRARDLTIDFNASSPRDPARRRRLLEELLGAFGDDSEIQPPLRVDYGAHLFIGERTFVNFGLVALDTARIRIGDDCQIGPGVQLLAPTHPLEAESRLAGWEAGKPITIGNNVWLGGGVIVCPGVTIGDDTVVGAGAVVTKDLPAGVLAVGNPARVVKEI